MRVYGFKLNSLEVEEINSICIIYNFSLDDFFLIVFINIGNILKYLILIEEDKKKVEEVLFLMDWFSVSEEFYY